jgi:hypothetical protein
VSGQAAPAAYPDLLPAEQGTGILDCLVVQYVAGIIPLSADRTVSLVHAAGSEYTVVFRALQLAPEKTGTTMLEWLRELAASTSTWRLRFQAHWPGLRGVRVDPGGR